MRVLLMGPPGAGKGTQAARLGACWDVPHVSTGDLLRDAVERGTELGRQVKRTLESGQLVSDDLMADLISERLGRPDCQRGFVLDGYPRTQRQARDLERLLKRAGTAVEQVFLLEVPKEIVLRRLRGRFSCPSCRAVYHVTELPADGPHSCERCGAALVARSDDSEATVRRRLAVYREQTEPLIEHYRRAGTLAAVNGVGSVEEVHERLLALAQAARR